MKKILSLVGIAIISAVASYAIAYLQDPKNYAKVSKATKKYSVELNKKTKELNRKAKPYLNKLDKEVKAFSKQAKRLYAKKLKEIKI